MAKKNSNKSAFSESNYIRQRVRTLPVGKCFTIPDWEEAGETVTIVTRRHPKGTVTAGVYLIDTFCLGVKDSFYRFSIEDYELEQLIEAYGGVEIEETDYAVVHNLIYGALEFAEEAGILPCKEFSLTQYILEEDTDAIPLMQFDYGKDGKHLLVADNRSQLDFYLSKLRKNLGDDFSYICRSGEGLTGTEKAEPDSVHDSSDAAGLIDIDLLKSLENFIGEIDSEEYTYTPDPDAYPAELTIVHKDLYDLFSDERYDSGFPDEILKKILDIPHDELRKDLEQMLLYLIGKTLSELRAGKDEYTQAATHCIMMLGEVGDIDSVAAILEALRQDHDFFDYNFGDTASEIFVPTLYLLGQENPDIFNDYLHEPGLCDFTRSYVISAVAMIADRQPARRTEIIGWLRKLLHFYIEKLPRKQCCDGTIAAYLVCDLVDINAVELLPDIRQLFDTGLVSESVCGDFDEIKNDISRKHSRTEISSYPVDLKERYRYYARWFRSQK